MTSKTDTFFLHYGPGGNAEVEKSMLGARLKNVYFWNQPILKEPSYAKLLDACTNEVHSFYVKSGKPIQLWGHSFGSNLALDIAKKLGKEISNLILCAPLMDVADGFLNLAKCSQQDSQTPIKIKESLKELIAKKPNDKKAQETYFWNYVGAITQDPAFPRLYWVNKDRFADYLQFATVKPGLDFPMWQAILSDYVQNYPVKPYSLKMPISVIIGEKDPYFDMSVEEEKLKVILPGAKIQIIKGIGHFCHLEWGAFTL